MGGKTSKTTTETKLPPSIEKAYNDLIAQAKPISNTPYQAYQGGVDGSGFEQNQLSAWNNIAGLAGSSNGVFNAAAGALGSTATPTYENVNSYMSPYMDSVVKATMANMNEQNAEQQQGVLGNAAAQGALGGNRVGVAQAELARQQNLANQQTISNLYNSGYNTALSAAQSDKAAALQAAGQYSDLGSTAMQANLAQAAAQAAAGTQQQQYNYQQYQTERSYPFQTTSWLANIVSGLGSGMGGTTTTSQPSGNTGSSILGGLLGIGSLFLNKGGVVHGEEERPHRAQGGVIPYGGASGIVGANNNQPPAANDNLGYVPDAATGTLGPGHSTLPSAQGNAPTQNTDPTLSKGLESMMSSVQKKYPNGILAGANPAPAASPASNVTSVPKAEVVPNPATDGAAGGGILSGLGKLFGFADGGVPHGYDAGGLVLPFDPDRFGPTTPPDLQIVGKDDLAASMLLAKAVNRGDHVPTNVPSGKDDRVTPAPVVDPQRFADGPVAQTPQALQKGLVSQQLNDGVLPPLQGPVADWPDRSGATVGDAAAPGTTAVPALPPPIDVAGTPKVAGVSAAPEGDGVIAPKAPEKPQNQYIEPFNKINADYGLPDGYLNRTAYIESRFDPQANNGISRGIFQFTGPTAGQYGLKNPYDPMASADAAARLASDNAKFLENGLGRPPTASELYLAHQQGAAGALNLLTHPNAAASDIVGRAAVVQNGGQAGMTAGQFANMWMKKYDGASGADSYVPSGGGRGTDVVNSPTATAQPSYTGVVPQEKTDNAQGIISSLLHGERPHVSDDVKMALLTAGLGMMASKSPFLGQGIGEGGLKGVEKWQELQKMHRENALAQSEIAGNQTRLGLEGVKTDIAGQNLALDAKKTASEIAKQTAETANLELANTTQRYQQTVTPAGIIVRDMTNPNAPPKLTTWEDIQRNGVPSEIKSNEAIGAGTASGSNTGAQGKTSRTAPEQDAAPQDKAVVAAPTKPVGGPVQVPDRIPVDTRLMSPSGQDIAKSETTDALRDARKEYLGASNSKIQLSEMKHDLSTIKDSAWTQPGSGFTNRVQWAKAVNTGFQTLGIEAPIDEKAVAAGEDLAKLTTRLGFDLSRSLGSNEAASVVDQSISAVPGGYNSPEGARRIIAGIEAANQRKIDHYQFLQQWSAKTGGSILGADEAFNQMYPPEAYVNNAMLSIATVPKTQADIDNAPKGTMFNVNGNLMVK